MKAFKLFLLSFAVIGSSAVPAARAADVGGLFLEPGITYQGVSDADINYPAPFSGTDGDIKGLGLMARLGVHVGEILFVAADGRYSHLVLKGSSVDSSGSAYNYGLTAGAQMPVAGLRAWAGWILGGAVNPSATSGFDAKYKSGSGWRLGAGLHIVLVSVNLEYQQTTFDELEVESIGPFSAGTSFSGTELKDKAWILSVTFPMEL